MAEGSRMLLRGTNRCSASAIARAWMASRGTVPDCGEVRNGAPDWNRTSNRRLRRPMLYPIELQARCWRILTGNHRRRASWRRTILGDFSTRHPVSPKFRASILRLLQTPHSPVGIPAHPRRDSALDATVTSAKKRLLWKVGTGRCVLDRQTRQGGPLSRADPKQRSRIDRKKSWSGQRDDSRLRRSPFGPSRAGARCSLLHPWLRSRTAPSDEDASSHPHFIQ